MSDALDKLNGAERVAALLLSLDKDMAAEVLQHLDDEVVSDVAEAMTSFDPDAASSDALDSLYVELSESLSGPESVRPVASQDLGRLLGASLGDERGERVMRKIEDRRAQERPFAAIEEFPPEAIARALRAESPAVAALVLSHVEPSTSASILGCYDEDGALDVVRRMASLVPPGFATLSAIASDLVEQLQAGGDLLAAAPDPSTRLQTIADMLSHSGQDLEQVVLTGIESEDAERAQEIREFMFTWGDLGSVDKRAMQKILASVNTKTLSVALKACPLDVEENILSNLSSRVREMVAEERELAGPMPMTEVEAARAEIMTAVRVLMDAGEFRPTRAGEDLVS